MKFSILTSCFLLLCACCFAQSRSVAKEGFLAISDFGIKEDGQTDHTSAIQQVIESAKAGETVYIPEGTFLVRTLFLKTGVNLQVDGVLKQHPSTKRGDFSLEKQNSPNPLLKGTGVNSIHISLNSQSINEAIVLTKSQKITIENSQLKGDSTKLLAYPGISIFQCSEIAIISSKISGFGMPRKNPDSYQPGTGIRIMTSNTISVRDSEIFNNGENGIFIHGSRKIEAINNVIHHNGMSAIQVAFGNTGKETDYRFVGNVMDQNAADAVDINNRSLQKLKDIDCLIYDNVSCNNGFVNNESTPDGSGIGTLINVSNVIIYKNTAVKNNRPAIYVESCDLILIKDNHADNQVEVVLDLGEMLVDSNEFSSINLMANVEAEKLTLRNNQFHSLSLPNGITVNDFVIENNTFQNASFNFNFKQGNILLRGNSIRSSRSSGAILLVNFSKATLEENKIESTGGPAITIRKTAFPVEIIKNEIRSVQACILEEGSYNLLLKENKFTALSGSDDNFTVKSNYPSKLRLENNEHHGIADQDAIVLIGTGTATIRGERLISGKSNYGKVKITE
ncbi:right-handed parallel beta-helix repeat-containing protein [Algoriphagus litoralis]|uniref:right-handed parallel beta-helix repeat-containing protein n=1 Tax=Algoriphagus litoralis TaxID=2202829 RepID=UPI000DB8FC9A|nr:right-handed parallel beta-helix repeat-containing protein [Algoriphagus litoralis]